MRQPAIALLAFGLVSPNLFAAAPPPPVRDFTDFAKYEGLAISPKGTHLALAHVEGDKHFLSVVEFPSMASRQTFAFGELNAPNTLYWLDEKRLLVQPARQIPEFRAGWALAGEIVYVDLEKNKTEMIYSWVMDRTRTGTKAGRHEGLSQPAQILSMRSGDPDQVLIEGIGAGYGGQAAGVYRLDVRNSHLSGIANSPVPGARFVLGPDDRVSVAAGVNEDYKAVLYHLEKGTGPGTDAVTWVRKSMTGRDEGSLTPVAWTGSGDVYYALDDRDAPTRGVVAWDAMANTQRLIFRNPDADVAAIVRDTHEKPWLILGDAGKPFYSYPDPNHPLVNLHRTLVQSLPNHFIEIPSHTDDYSIAVARISSAQRPPTYLVVDVKTAKPLQVMATYPTLKPEMLSPVTPIEFAARDGLKIRGFLTTPRTADGKPARNLPMLVVLHGGPHNIYDTSDYDPERQLFASRGYAVLQVNFRGSGGRGRQFEGAGFGEWGRKMQDDVTDAVKWAVGQGIADPARMCIYGGSYGAYSALVGVEREPDMFKCAIGMAGVYDLPLMFEKGDIAFARSGRSYLREELGGDMADLRDRSPVNHADRIKAKVLLLHGSTDVRAPIEHAQRMRKALTDAGNTPQWVVETEGHGFSDQENRAAAYEKMLAFLAQNIGN